MPKVYTSVAAKDYPDQGIAKGDVYYSWSFYRQRPQKSKTYPTRSQLTQDDCKIRAYDAIDGLQHPSVITNGTTAEDVAGAIREAAEELEGASQDFQEKRENLPDNFQDGDAGQAMQDAADECESVAGELNQIADEVEDGETYWDEEGGTKTLNYDAIREAVSQHDVSF